MTFFEFYPSRNKVQDLKTKGYLRQFKIHECQI